MLAAHQLVQLSWLGRALFLSCNKNKSNDPHSSLLADCFAIFLLPSQELKSADYITAVVPKFKTLPPFYSCFGFIFDFLVVSSHIMALMSLETPINTRLFQLNNLISSQIRKRHEDRKCADTLCPCTTKSAKVEIMNSLMIIFISQLSLKLCCLLCSRLVKAKPQKGPVSP